MMLVRFFGGSSRGLPMQVRARCLGGYSAHMPRCAACTRTPGSVASGAFTALPSVAQPRLWRSVSSVSGGASPPPGESRRSRQRSKQRFTCSGRPFSSSSSSSTSSSSFSPPSPPSAPSALEHELEQEQRQDEDVEKFYFVRSGQADVGSKRVVAMALAGNGAITLIKFGAFIKTGSSAMLAETIHSLVDTGNQGCKFSSSPFFYYYN